jgi:hypothetical protein
MKKRTDMKKKPDGREKKTDGREKNGDTHCSCKLLLLLLLFWSAAFTEWIGL